MTFQPTGPEVPRVLRVWVSHGWGFQAGLDVAQLSPLCKLFAGWVKGVSLYSVRTEL